MIKLAKRSRRPKIRSTRSNKALKLRSSLIRPEEKRRRRVAKADARRWAVDLSPQLKLMPRHRKTKRRNNTRVQKKTLLLSPVEIIIIRAIIPLIVPYPPRQKTGYNLSNLYVGDCKYRS